MRLAVGMIIGLALAWPTPPAFADEAGQLKLAHDVVVAAHMSDNMRKLLPTMMQQFRPMLLAQGNNDAAAVDAYMKRLSEHFDKAADRFTDLAAEVYAREFSEDDLRGFPTFNQSPAGQHMVEKQTVIAQAMMLAGQKWGQLEAQEVLEEFRKEREDKGAPKL